MILNTSQSQTIETKYNTHDEEITAKLPDEKAEEKLRNKLEDSYLMKIFFVLNEEYFGGKLVLCRVKWSERIGMGKHCNKLSDFTVFEDRQFLPVIRLSRSLLLKESKERVAETLFCAMVHIWLWTQKKPWGHTQEFYSRIKIFDHKIMKEKLQDINFSEDFSENISGNTGNISNNN